MADSLILSPPPTPRPIRRRTRRDPKPRFKPASVSQLDGVRGCPELQVPPDHLARTVRRLVGPLDVSAAEARYSSLGRHGYHPRDVLAVWVYASMIGIHEASKVAKALTTDAAFQWLAGGHQLSPATLKRFRQKNGVLFADAIEQTVRIAVKRGLVKPEEISVDSVRIRAHASMSELRTSERSQKRIEALLSTDTTSLSDSDRSKHEQRLAKHEETVKRCREEKRTEIVRTNPLAARQKFPGGGVQLGHRVTVAAAGHKIRLAISVLVEADQSDAGKLRPAVEQARAVLLQSGIPPDAKMRVTADSGYTAQSDLAFAASNPHGIDVLAPVDDIDRSKSTKRGFFGRDRFVILPDGSARCPADKPMRGPYNSGRRRTYQGVGCTSCALRPQCTESKKRVLHLLPVYDQLRAAMHDRMAQPGAADRYKRRAATIEPVFSSVEHDMKFRRCSSRHPDTIAAEILLKLLAHNLRRLASASKSSCVWIRIEIEF